MVDETLCGYHAGPQAGRRGVRLEREWRWSRALAPGDWVRNPLAPEWGLGQVQSVIGDRVTANFENAGKRLINAAVVSLTRVKPPAPPSEMWPE